MRETGPQKKELYVSLVNSDIIYVVQFLFQICYSHGKHQDLTIQESLTTVSYVNTSWVSESK